jgi:hypothetical protein
MNAPSGGSKAGATTVQTDAVPQRETVANPSHESRQPPEVVPADVQALKAIEHRHDRLQAVPIGALGAIEAREAATSDAGALNSFSDKTLQALAAITLGETADQHPSYKAALLEVSPPFAGLAQQAYAGDQQRSEAKDDRKAFEFADRRDDAADNIATRYANMARAGLSVTDLQGPALDRLAIKDSHDLLLIDGLPRHLRADEAKALVADSLKIDAYRATFVRETSEWTAPQAGRNPGLTGPLPSVDSQDRAAHAGAGPTGQEQSARASSIPDRAGTGANSMRSQGDTVDTRRPIPPLEDRFNVMTIGLVDKEYHFRDQAGKVAFTDKLLSISTASENPAAIKAMVDRAAERGWDTVKLDGSPEFVRQAWIAATAQGLNAVGHTPTLGDQEAVSKERTRLEAGRSTEALHRPADAIKRVQVVENERVKNSQGTAAISGPRQLAAAIERALVEGKVSPEIRGQVRDMMAAEGARRLARGERFKVPVYDARAPRARAKTVQPGPRVGDRERSR